MGVTEHDTAQTPAGVTNEVFYKERAEYWRAQYDELHAHIEQMRSAIMHPERKP